ncbi:MAG: SRPBCC family protein [Angustibacter sp.]
MRVSGSATLHADPDRVYRALGDPAVLVATIPGCQELVQLSPDRYRMTVTAGVAAVRGTYDGEVSLADQQPPTSLTLRARGSGAAGTVDATCRVRLSDAGGGTTRVDYDADAAVGGAVGGVGQRMLGGVARRMAGEFFTAVDGVLTEAAQPAAPLPDGPLPDGPSPAGGGATGGGATAVLPTGALALDQPAVAAQGATSSAGGSPVSYRPAARAADDGDRVPFWVVLAGVGAGAFWALAGVLVGWRIARDRRDPRPDGGAR